MLNRPFFGVGMAVGAAVLWGTTGIAQSLLVGDASPFWVGALRLMMACVFFGVIGAFASNSSDRALPIDRAAWCLVVVCGACIAVYNLAFFAGVRLSGVGVGTAIAIGSGPIWTGLLQNLITKKAPALEWWIGALLAIAGGTALIAGNNGGVVWTGQGLLLCLVAGLAYSCYALMSKSLVRQFAPAVIVPWIFIAATSIAVPVAAALPGAFTLSLTNGLVVVYLGLIATGASYLMFSYALQHISGATGVTLALAEPVTAFLLSAWLLGYSPADTGYIGLGLILTGLLIVVRSEVRPACVVTTQVEQQTT